MLLGRGGSGMEHQRQDMLAREHVVSCLAVRFQAARELQAKIMLKGPPSGRLGRPIDRVKQTARDAAIFLVA
jgi:hypothetical protein